FTTQYSWSETLDSSQSGPGSIDDTYFVSINEGANWAAPTGIDGAHQFAINVIPEPGTALLCLAGLLGLARIGRRGARK
ncbi:MAG: hypothetical protein HKP27_15200, partial [Myxococcales bacterium]|nr:hypothetical protein [Myxococcales bacterium]